MDTEMGMEAFERECERLLQDCRRREQEQLREVVIIEVTLLLSKLKLKP